MTDAERYRFILNSRIAQINFELDKIYSGAEFQLVNAVINSDITDYDLQKNPALKKRIEDIINKLSAVTTRIVIAGAESSWALSNKKNDDMVHKIFKGKKEIPAHYLTQTNPQNDKAFSAFIDRKTNGFNLSENVWKYNEGYKTQIENALQVGIGNGVSANEMSKYLTQYLQNPTATIAEYDDENISAQIPQSKKAQPGVYASPKKNAMRLARTEINMAYDTADYNRWQNLDFVVGFEVRTSGNHTTKDKKGKIIKIVDICDKLAGKYPKDFKFTGWHPQCRCYMTSILKSDEEQDDEDLAILRGEDPEKKESENTVKDVPEGFKQWVKENQGRLEKSDSLPYFVRDNKEYFSEVDFKSVVSKQFEESKDVYGSIKKYSSEMEYSHKLPFQSKDQIKIKVSEEAKNIQDEIIENGGFQKEPNMYDWRFFIEAIMPKITKEEAGIILDTIRAWSGVLYKDIRKKQNLNKKSIKGDLLETFISAAPIWINKTYRYIGIDNQWIDYYIKCWKNKIPISQLGTASWSRKEYKNVKGKNALFICTTPNMGTSIENYAMNSQEFEVLCSKKARYLITNYEYKDPFHTFTVECVNYEYRDNP